jgi:tetratricopeptide (TPR) repeat protein
LKQALATQLEQSPYLNLLPESRIREALRFMGRPEDQRITSDVAREICVRENAKAMLTGSIASLGSHYVISLAAVNAQTGDSIATEQAESESKEQVLKSLDKAATSLRSKLGESLPSVQKFATPLEQATTSSLEALQAYSVGHNAHQHFDDEGSIPHFQKAVTLDPNNAEMYFNRAQTNYDRGTLDLVENKEPLLVNPTTKSWLDAAASDFEKAAEIDPKNSLTLDRLGLTYEQADEEDKAVRAYTQEWALDRLGKQRLADAYCFFGFRHQQQKELAAAAAAYQKSIEFGVADDKSCPYDALGNGIEIYTIETREYDKAWEMVHQAQKANRLIAPELIERLKKDSKRTR